MVGTIIMLTDCFNEIFDYSIWRIIANIPVAQDSIHGYNIVEQSVGGTEQSWLDVCPMDTYVSYKLSCVATFICMPILYVDTHV